MKKIVERFVVVALTVLFLLMLSLPAFAGDHICFWTDCFPQKAEKLEACPKTTAAISVTPGDILAIFPEAYVVDGVASYWFGAKDVAVGPSYVVAKVWQLVSLNAYFGVLSKGGNVTAGGGAVNFVDILTKINPSTPPPQFVINMNPSLGALGGYRTSTPTKDAGWDGAVQVKILNLDISKAFGYLGL